MPLSKWLIALGLFLDNYLDNISDSSCYLCSSVSIKTSFRSTVVDFLVRVVQGLNKRRVESQTRKP